MSWLRQNSRFLAAVQLLPALESGEETLVGGQAVLEGVMMRSPHACAIAVRRPDGSIATHREPVVRPSERHKWLGWPVIRGVATLGQAMALGFRALKFSADVALEEIPREPEQKKLEIPAWVAALNVLLSVGFFIAMYKIVPAYATQGLAHYWPSFNGHVLFNLVDGAIRLALFLFFIWAVSLWADIRRVYEFHGAEHKTVFAFEHGDPLEIEAAQKYSTFHPRCGTSFLMTVMLLSIVFYMFFPVHTLWARIALRIALLPVIVGVSYEIIRYAAKRRTSLFALLTRPGLWMQRITTKPPSDAQVECAIRALDDAMVLERERGGELVIA